jgi:hypothetical protein
MKIKRVLLTGMLALALTSCAALADIGPVGTVETPITGVSVDEALACQVEDLSAESKALIAEWSDLVAKLQAETITDAEGQRGAELSYPPNDPTCMWLMGGIPGTVVLLDGHDYLVDYCIEGIACIRVIQSSDGFTEDL